MNKSKINQVYKNTYQKNKIRKEEVTMADTVKEVNTPKKLDCDAAYRLMFRGIDNVLSSRKDETDDQSNTPGTKKASKVNQDSEQTQQPQQPQQPQQVVTQSTESQTATSVDSTDEQELTPEKFTSTAIQSIMKQLEFNKYDSEKITAESAKAIQDAVKRVDEAYKEKPLASEYKNELVAELAISTIAYQSNIFEPVNTEENSSFRFNWESDGLCIPLSTVSSQQQPSNTIQKDDYESMLEILKQKPELLESLFVDRIKSNDYDRMLETLKDNSDNITDNRLDKMLEIIESRYKNLKSTQIVKINDICEENFQYRHQGRNKSE